MSAICETVRARLPIERALTISLRGFIDSEILELPVKVRLEMRCPIKIKTPL